MTQGKLRSPQKPSTDILIGKQQEAYQKLKTFHESGERMFCFEGYAGVGKSFCINMFVEDQISNYGTQICLATPTHKALTVLKQMAEFTSENLDYCTIHSLLGLKPVVTEGGKETFVKDNANKNRVEEFDLIIIDESSMLDDKLFFYLMEELDFHAHLKIIFVGDGKQLPPVNHVSSAPMNPVRRQEHEIGHSVLTEIIRQKGTNPIITLSKDIREGTFNPKTELNDEGHGVVVVRRGDYRKVLERMFTSGEYEANQNYCRVVAWTNLTVNEFNVNIRKMIYKNKIKDAIKMAKKDGVPEAQMIEDLKKAFPFYRKGRMDLPKYLIGDKVIVDKPIFTDDGSQILFQTNEELIIEDYTIEDRMGLGSVYTCYIAQVRNLFTGKVEIIEICHEDSEIELGAHMERLKRDALKQPKGVKSRNKWITYYKLDKRFSRLKYAPCLTTYKSQGSTYENIIVATDDIMRNPKRQEILQHLYVGVTRASKRCFLLV